jgi:predicted dehydrogenase
MIMVRIGFLGAGRVVQNRYVDVCLNELKGAQVVSVCDPVKERADKVAKLLRCKSVYKEEDLFNDPDVQVIVICTESGKHHAHTQAALRAGKHVIVEKPPAMFPEEIMEDQALAAQKNKLYAIFQNRFNPAMRKLKEAVEQGRFGKIVLATIRLRWCRYQEYYQDGWHGTWAMDGGVINQQAIHHLDALQWIGGSIEKVFAMQSNALNKLEAEDTTAAVVKFRSGALGVIEATTAARPDDFEASISIVGEKGCVVIGGIALNKIETWRFIDPRPEDKDVPRQYSQEVPTGYGLSHGPLMQMIIDRLEKGDLTAPIVTESVLPTLGLIHALYRSAEIQRPVALQDGVLSNRLGK